MNVNLSGGRYVYFNTIEEPYYSFGLGVISSVNGMLSPKIQEDNSINTHIDNIGKYIQFIQDMADSARDNELAFLEQQFSLLSQKDIHNPKITDWLKQLQDGVITANSYQEIYNMFNTLLNDSDYAEIQLEQTLRNLNNTKDIFTKLPEAIRQKLYTLHDENMKYYRATFFKEGSKVNPEAVKQYCETLSSAAAKKINKILKSFSKNNDFKELFIAALKSSPNLDISDEEFKTLVVNYIVDMVLSEGLDEMITTDKLKERITNNVIYDLPNLKGKYAHAQYSNSIFSPNMSLEELALTTDQSLGTYLNQLDVDSLKTIKNKYAQNNVQLAQNINNLIDIITDVKHESKMSRSLQTSLTRQLRASIRNYVTVEGKLQKELPKMLSQSEFQSLATSIENFTTPVRLRSAIINGLSGLSITHDAVEEIRGMKEFQDNLVNILEVQHGGKRFKFKIDFNISTGTCASNLSNVFDEKKVADIINTTLQDQSKKFFTRYQDATSGQTDIEAAMDIYTKQIQEMEDQIKKAIELDSSIIDKEKAQRDVYRELENTFSIGVSVKDYNLYNNTLGHHGGSLGSYTAPEQVMKNIYTMYQLGGITAIDVNTLMTAVINCGDAMIGSFLRPSLETYLLGGAALIMFDNSFAQSDVFLEKMGTQLKGQKVVSLYRLESKYVPASMILTKIGNNLKQIYMDIENNNPLTNTGNHVTIINNVTEAILHNKKIKQLEPQAQWNAVRDYTEKNIKIQFSFMAGLLDILEGIPAAFDVT